MKFLLDERAEARIAAFLNHRGHDATRIARDYPAGLPDEQVLEIARNEGRIVVANDKDFGELIVRRALPHAGVLLLRFPLDAKADEKIAAIERVIATHRNQLDRFLVISPQGVRVR